MGESSKFYKVALSVRLRYLFFPFLLYSYMFVYTTKIVYDVFRQQHFCKATFSNSESFLKPSDKHTIQSINFGLPMGYPKNHLYLYSFECQSHEDPVINSIEIDLQDPIVYQNNDYCVDYVEIDPPIPRRPATYCGHHTFDCSFRFRGPKKVKVLFRTSEKNNGHAGFKIVLSCASSLQAEAEALLEYLQPPTKSTYNNQQVKP